MAHEDLHLPPPLQNIFSFDNGIVANSLTNALSLGALPGAINRFDENQFAALLLSDFKPNPALNLTTIKQLFSGFILNTATKVNDPFQPVPFPTTWQDFISKWQAWVSTKTNSLGDPLYPPNDSHNPNLNFYKAFLVDYLGAQGSSIDSSLTQLSGDLTIFNTQPPVVPPLNFSYPPTSQNPFVQAFNHFLSDFDLNTFLDKFIVGKNFPGQVIDFVTGFGKPDPVSGTEGFPTFFGDFYNHFTTTVATVQTADKTTNPALFSNLPSYQQVFMGFGPPGATQAQFQLRLKQFYQTVVSRDGYFLPSDDFHEWLETIRGENGYNTPIKSGLGSLTDINGKPINGSDKMVVINNILALLILLITALQKIGISQAKRLQFTTQFQQAYTALQTQIKPFLSADHNPLGGDAGKEQRNDINNTFHTILVDNLRTLRGLQEDSGKKQQSDVNATSDAVNQQTDMCSTFIQQLSSLLSVILK